MKRTSPVLFLMLGACGNGNDTIWSGLSGVVIFILIVWALVHVIRK